MRNTALMVAVMALCAAPAAAQTVKDGLAEDWARSRQNTLAILDAMPASALGFRPTEGVRSFAEQIEHVAVGNVGIVAGVLSIPRDQRRGLGDRAVYLGDKAALRAMVVAAYDYVDELLAGLAPADLEREVTLFGQPGVPLWRAMRAGQEHATWTLGSVVPYLRLSGATPPAYMLLPGVPEG